MTQTDTTTTSREFKKKPVLHSTVLVSSDKNFQISHAREVVVVTVCVAVPHVGGEVAVDVGVREVRGEAQAEDEASYHALHTF